MTAKEEWFVLLYNILKLTFDLHIFLKKNIYYKIKSEKVANRLKKWYDEKKNLIQRRNEE